MRASSRAVRLSVAGALAGAAECLRVSIGMGHYVRLFAVHLKMYPVLGTHNIFPLILTRHFVNRCLRGVLRFLWPGPAAGLIATVLGPGQGIPSAFVSRPRNLEINPKNRFDHISHKSAINPLNRRPEK